MLDKTFKTIYFILVCAIFVQLFSTFLLVDFNDEKVIGEYLIDKFDIRDTTLKAQYYPTLLINKNHIFELKDVDEKAGLVGKWKALNQKKLNFKDYDNILIEFTYNVNQKIQAELDGNIIYFYYPNDFYKGKFNRVLYVRKN